MQIKTMHWIGVMCFLGTAATLHGMWTYRWGASPQGNLNVDLLSPLEGPIGDWEPAEKLEKPRDAQMHTVTRRFLSLKDNRLLIVSQISGIPGHVATHTPDVCYPGSGFAQKTAIEKEMFLLPNGGVAEFWRADFKKTTATGSETVRVRWAWSTDGVWNAPSWPRWFYARAPVLHKLYIVHPLSEEEDLSNKDPYKDFVAPLIAQLKLPPS